MGDISPGPPPPVQWYRSQRFIALVQSTIVFVIGWVIQALSMNDWTLWKALLIAVLGNILIQLKDWWSPQVIGPMAFMNRNVP
jgi:hypothetical protein